MWKQSISSTLLFKVIFKIETHKRFKRMLFIMRKHNMWIFVIIPFLKREKKSVKQRKMRCRILTAFGWAVSLCCFGVQCLWFWIMFQSASRHSCFRFIFKGYFCLPTRIIIAIYCQRLTCAMWPVALYSTADHHTPNRYLTVYCLI